MKKIIQVLGSTGVGKSTISILIAKKFNCEIISADSMQVYKYFDIGTDKISKDKKVVIYCRSGNRSANLIKALEQQFGFDNLYNLKGGILDWSDEIDDSILKY